MLYCREKSVKISKGMGFSNIYQQKRLFSMENKDNRKNYKGQKPNGYSKGGNGKNDRKSRFDGSDYSGRKNFTRKYDEHKPEFNDRNSETGSADTEYGNGAVIGRNAVRELLRSERPIDKILVRRGDREGSITELVARAIERGIPVIEVDKSKLDAISDFAPHQGIVAMAAEKEYSSVEDILQIAADRGEKPLIVISDGITDPYNLGSLIRCAEGVGAHGLIISKRRAVGLTPLVSKASAGAIEHLAIAKVANISTTIDVLKKQGIWVFAAEAGGSAYYDTDFDCPCAIVFGSEGNGVSRIVKENSDFITSIPMYGHVNSFNVSTAASVILSEAARQQKGQKKQ